MDVVLAEGDAFAEQAELTVGSDGADDFDAAFGGRTVGWLIASWQGGAQPVMPHLVGGGTGVGAVAVVGVVELDERGVLGAEVLDVGEHFGSEERFVPHVVEVFDDTVAPRLAHRDEPGGDVQVETRRHGRRDVLPCRWDPAAEVGVVAELGDRWHADTPPDAAQCLDEHAGAGLGDDVVSDTWPRSDVGALPQRDEARRGDLDASLPRPDASSEQRTQFLGECVSVLTEPVAAHPRVRPSASGRPAVSQSEGLSRLT